MTMKRYLLVLVGGALLLVGRWSAGWGDRDGTPSSTSTAETPSVWSCPMHPQIRLPEAGGCPLCGMDLAQNIGAADHGEHPRRLTWSPAARELARIETQPVVRKEVTRSIRLVGKIDFDETAVRTISAWVSGRLDRLYVDYTGVRVERGDHLVRLFSPELLTAQEELLSARQRRFATAREDSPFLAGSNQRAYEAAREKLLLWGLTVEQVDAIEERGSAEDHVMLSSPSSGVIIEKYLDEGAYVETGTRVYKIADLSQLWVRLDAYEQDLAWLRHGQTVRFEVEALPGERFEGRISYIDPVVSDHTRSAKVRVNIDNSDGHLKPGMFVRARTAVRLGAKGEVLDRELAGKWVSPMHPEIVKEEPGQCDVCGMDLVQAEELGLVSDEVPSEQRPLVVPQTAVLVTGTRAVVYVEVAGSGDASSDSMAHEDTMFEGREVLLGPRAGDEYIVHSGLSEGERVVVNGAFRIDSAMQIRAKPSMMSMLAKSEEHAAEDGRWDEFRGSLRGTYDAYLAIQVALAGDDLGASLDALEQLAAALEERTGAELEPQDRAEWNSQRDALLRAVDGARAQEGIEAVRISFKPLSDGILSVVRTFGYEGAELREAHCPMAFDGDGGHWLEAGEELSNPYFGASMLRCGTTMPLARR